MSTSRHPVAYRLEQLVDGPTKLLATVMGLPLVDGIFPALVLAGALSQPLQIVETGLLIFGGSATMAVILAEMDGTPREHVAAILVLAAVLLPLAALEAALAETIKSLLDLAVFKRFAALVILAVAAKTASAEVGELLPRPGAIIGLGLLASLSPAGVTLVVDADPVMMVKAAAAAGVGVAFALGVAVAGPRLRGRVDLDRFRFGSAVALGVLGLSVLELGIVGTEHPVALGVLLVTAVFSYDPSGKSSGDADPTDDDSDDPSDPSADDGSSTDEEPAPAPDDDLDDVGDTPGEPVADVIGDVAGEPSAVVDGESPAVSARESWGTMPARTAADGAEPTAPDDATVAPADGDLADDVAVSGDDAESGGDSAADTDDAESGGDSADADDGGARAPWL
ncbi:DUF5794 domain-containing protein [Halobaculum sp. MBLA0143]|uniref:DUF5794 domain-containing protein n=1 Tax=Halobaculum sp. MBLA0143 TaxID=3079933 RepID=UPI0035246088